MANDCSTTYKIVGETTELQAIYQVLNTLREQKGEDGILLADIVDYLGGDCRSMLSCRGEVTCFEMQDGILVMHQLTAWCEQKDFRLFLEAQYPPIKVYYRDEEYNGNEYWTNDTTGQYFPERYVMYSEQAVEYFITLEEAMARVKQVTGQQHITTEEQMLQATEDFVEPEYHTPIYILRKFSVDE